MNTLARARRRRAGAPARRALRLLAIGLAAGTFAGCSTLLGGGMAGGDPFEPWDAEDGDVVVLDIQNRNTREARIYAHWNGMRSRVGEVRGMDDARLQVQYRPGNLRIEVDFVGADGFVSQPYSVGPGEVIRFRIPS